MILFSVDFWCSFLGTQPSPWQALHSVAGGTGSGLGSFVLSAATCHHFVVFLDGEGTSCFIFSKDVLDRGSLFFFFFFFLRGARVTCVFFVQVLFVVCFLDKCTTQVDKLVYRVIKQQSGSVDDGMLWDIVMTINVDWECSDSALFSSKF